MTELGERLLARAEASFANKLKKDSKLRKLAREARKSTSYKVANEYSARAGELCSEALKETCGDMATMAQVAGEVLPPLLDADHKVVSEVSQQVMSNIIEDSDLSLPALTAEMDVNRVSGLVTAAQKDQSWEVLSEQVINFSQAVADMTLKRNADRDLALGLQSQIIRETDAPRFPEGKKKVKSKKGKVYEYAYSRYSYYEKPCEWCRKLAGTYAYKDVSNRGNNVFRRHRGCRCTTEYRLGKQAVDVWSKATWTAGDAEAKKKAIAEKERLLRLQSEEKRKRQARTGAEVAEIMRETGYSKKAATAIRNKYKKEIEAFGGVGFVIDIINNTNPNAKGHWSKLAMR